MSLISLLPGEVSTMVATPIPRGAFLFRGRYLDDRPALWGAACTACHRIYTDSDMYSKASVQRVLRYTPGCLPCVQSQRERG